MKTLALATLAATALSAVGGTLYTENFRNYADQAPNVVADNGMVVANDPIWARAAELNVNAKADGPVFVKPIALPDDGRFDLLVNFRFLNASAKNPVRFTVDLGGTSFDVTPEKIAGLEVKPAILNNAWIEFAVKANGAKAEVFCAQDRAYAKLGEIPLKKATALNFRAFAGQGFSLRDIVVRTPEALPSHPVTDLCAAFASRAKPFPGAKKAAGGESVPLTLDGSSKLRFRMGATNRTAKLLLEWSDGRKEENPVRVNVQKFDLRGPAFGLKKGTLLPLADATVSIGRYVEQYVRPYMRNWCSLWDMEVQGKDVLREWETLPAASQHVFDLELVKTASGDTQLWLDGSFVETLRGRQKQTVVSAAFLPGAGVEYLPVATQGEKRDGARFLPIDLAENPRAKAFVGAKAVAKLPAGVPMKLAQGRDSADVAICHEGKGNWGLEVEEYLGRSPTWGFTSAVHYRVPAADWHVAHLLFALDDDPAKDRILTVRFGHYLTNGTGGNTLGDVRIDFKEEDAEKVGEVTRGGKTFPLYYLAVKTNLDPILDIAAREGFLDFEFMGRGFESFQQIDNAMKPHPDHSSAFNVFAVTLERSPITLDMKEYSPGNVFNVDEEDRKVGVVTRGDAKGTVAWVAKDLSGKEVFSGSADIAGPSNLVDVALGAAKETGLYALEITLKDAAGADLVAHTARFAVLPPAQRAVEKEKSPFSTWWFSAHGSPGAYELGCPLMRKAGIMKSSSHSVDAAAAEKYGLTASGNVNLPWKQKDEETWVKAVEKAMSQSVYVDHFLVWHESAPHSGIPEEVLDLPVPEKTEADVKAAEAVNWYGSMVRKHFPDKKIQIGNSSASIGAVVRPLRGGANPDYYDYLGIETPSQVIVPERVIECGFLGMFVSQEAYKAMTGKTLKANGCWEFIYRCTRDMGEQQVAEWYMRDTLISLAHDFFLIGPGLLIDCKNGYYNGLWGASGIIQRAPYLYPKRAYVAYATLTSVMDGVKFSRAFDTGSTTVYAVEYRRLDGKYATALWCSRGDADFKVVAASGFLGLGGGGTVTELYGATRSLPGGESVVKGGTSPVYLVTEKPLESVTVGERRYPKTERILAHATTQAKLPAAKIEVDPQMESKGHRFLPILKPATFALEKTDEGLAVTLDLEKSKNRSKFVTEYTTVRFAEPVPLKGEPSVIGIRTKGNSNWGQLRFEIEDADGEVFKNLSTGSAWGCDIMDWPGNLAVNFDGWDLCYTALRDNTIMNDRSPGPVSDQWVSTGGDKKIKYPIKVRAVTVGMNRWASNLFGFEPLKNPTIVLGDVVGAE